MIPIAFNGFKLGMVLTFLVGPVFFTILQTSVERGFWRGAQVAVGVSLSDILYVTICYLGLAQGLVQSSFKVYMAYAGGAILIGFGLYHLFVKSRRPLQSLIHPITEKHFTRYMLKGFVINGMTPMVLFFWIGAVSLATIDFGYSGVTEFALFFGAVLVTVLATDITKAYLAGKLRRLITPRFMTIMNVLLGIVLIFFGFRLILLAKTFTIG
ncbi:MAG TPA: LysE family transporter [Cyclobacteriaceae bacterium]|nr:LysE family transporter [Cyclobacteriaceae bacterium]